MTGKGRYFFPSNGVPDLGRLVRAGGKNPVSRRRPGSLPGKGLMAVERQIELSGCGIPNIHFATDGGDPISDRRPIQSVNFATVFMIDSASLSIGRVEASTMITNTNAGSVRFTPCCI